MQKRIFSVGALSDIGQVKASNQDSILVKIGEEKHGEFGLFIVADGMGGLSYGAVASELVIHRFDHWWNEELYRLIKIDEIGCMDYIERDLSKLILLINDDMLELGRSVGKMVGSTISLLFIYRDNYIVRHVGDSRVYLINSKIKKITEDQTWVAKEVDEGRLTKEEAENHPRKHTLLQCLGVDPVINIFKTHGDTKASDSFVVCSDGFYNQMHEWEIMEGMNQLKHGSHEHPQAMAEEFMKVVKSRGAKDNVSEIIVCQWMGK